MKAFSGTDHRCLWVDSSYSAAFRQNMPPIVCPQMRWLHCQDPHLVANFNSSLQVLYKKYNLLPRLQALDHIAQLPLSTSLAIEYEALDELRCQCITKAAKGCWKLCTGQVTFPPEL